MKLQLGKDAYNRSYASEAEIILKNRFLEKNPTSDDNYGLISRPGTSQETTVGSGPIQNLYTLKGLFSSALFIASGGAMFFRNVPPTSVNTPIAGSIDPNSTPRMAGVSGAGYQRVFIADGTTLQYYGGQQYDAILTLTPGAINDDIVTIDGIVYQFAKLGPLDAALNALTVSGTIADDKVNIGANTYQFTAAPSGSHAGTSGDPWQVKVNGSNTAALLNLLKAINLTGVAGTDYDNGVTLNANVAATYSTATALGVRAKVAGLAGNAITTTITVVTGSDGLAWDNATLVKGQITSQGTLASPHNVFVNGSDANALTNLRAAVNASGVAGTDYSSGVTQNLRAEASANTALTVTIRGRVGGAPNPTIIVTVTTFGSADGLAFNHNPLAAGAQTLYGVATPGSVGMSDVVVLKSFVLVLQANSQRVYFLLPGTTVIDPLNFFEAESSPDFLNGMIAVGDQVWLIGQGTVEPWYATGDATAPFAPVQGRPISHGGRTGTFVGIANKVILVGEDKVVYDLSGAATPISTNGIAERVRKFIEAGG